MDFSRDGTSFFVGFNSSSDGVFQWDILKDERIATFQDVGDRGLIVSPDGKGLLVNDYDKIQLLDIATGELLYTLEAGKLVKGVPYSQQVNDFDISQDGTKLVASTDADITIWDLETQKLLKTIDRRVRDQKVSVEPEGRFFASGGRDKRLRIWNLDGEVEHELLLDKSIRQIRFSGDGSKLAIATGSGRCYVVTTLTGEILNAVDDDEAGWLGRGPRVAFSPDGQFLAIAKFHPDLFDETAERLIKRFSDRNALASQLNISDSSQSIWSGIDNKTLRRRNLKSGRLEGLLKLPGFIPPALGLSKDGLYFAYPDSAHNIIVTSILDRSVVHKMVGHENRVMRITFSPDGKYLATAGKDAQVIVWHLEDGTIQRKLRVIQCS